MHRGFMNMFPTEIGFNPGGVQQTKTPEADVEKLDPKQQGANQVTTESVFSRYDTDGANGKGNGSVSYQEASAGKLVSVFTEGHLSSINSFTPDKADVSNEQLNALKSKAWGKLGGAPKAVFEKLVGNFAVKTGSIDVEIKAGDDAQKTRNDAAAKLDNHAISGWAQKSQSINDQIVKDYRAALNEAYQEAVESNQLDFKNETDPNADLKAEEAAPKDMSSTDAKGEVKEVEVYATLDQGQDKHVDYKDAQTYLDAGMNIKADISMMKDSAGFETAQRYLDQNFNGQQLYSDIVQKFDYKSGSETVKDQSKVQAKQTEMNTKVKNKIQEKIGDANKSVSKQFQKAINIVMNDMVDGQIESHNKKGLSDNSNGATYVNGGQMKNAANGNVQVFSKFDNNSDGTANIKDGGVQQLFDKAGKNKAANINLNMQIDGVDKAKLEGYVKGNKFDVERAINNVVAEFSTSSTATVSKNNAQKTITELNATIENQVNTYSNNINNLVNIAFQDAVKANADLKADVTAGPVTDNGANPIEIKVPDGKPGYVATETFKGDDQETKVGGKYSIASMLGAGGINWTTDSNNRVDDTTANELQNSKPKNVKDVLTTMLQKVGIKNDEVQNLDTNRLMKDLISNNPSVFMRKGSAAGQVKENANFAKLDFPTADVIRKEYKKKA